MQSSLSMIAFTWDIPPQPTLCPPARRTRLRASLAIRRICRAADRSRGDDGPYPCPSASLRVCRCTSSRCASRPCSPPSLPGVRTTAASSGDLQQWPLPGPSWHQPCGCVCIVPPPSRSGRQDSLPRFAKDGLFERRW